MRFGSEYIEYKKKTPFIIPITILRTGSKKLGQWKRWEVKYFFVSNGTSFRITADFAIIRENCTLKSRNF